MNVPRWIIPLLAIGFMIGGYALRLNFTNPTTNVVYAAEADGSDIATMVATVQGVKCKGTAGFFTKMYKEEAGIYSITTFASEHKAIIKYDPTVTTPEQIKAVMEQELTFGDGSRAQVFECMEMKVK